MHDAAARARECAIPIIFAQASRSTIQLLRRKRMNDHDQHLSRAFDSQAPKFEAPVQSDPVAIERLVREAGFPAGGSCSTPGADRASWRPRSSKPGFACWASTSPRR